MKSLLASLLIGTAAFATASPVYSHPGRTNSSGCHTCRTNCFKWGLSSGQYHCHGDGGSSASSRSKRPKPPPPPAPVRLLDQDELPAGGGLPENSIVVRPGQPPKASRGAQVEGIAVVDGDTFVAREGERIYLLTLRDLEAPELEQMYGYEARERLTGWVMGRRLVVWPEKAGGCVIPVRVETLSGTDVSEQLLTEGSAWASRSASDGPRRLEAAARLKRVGIWRAEEPEPPWEYRARRTMARKP